jgi:hypothetical protein
MERLSCIQVHWQYHTCIPQLPSACASLRACPPRCCTPAYANTVTNMDGKSSESKLPDRENMGWLATSAVPAKKRRMIEGQQPLPPPQQSSPSPHVPEPTHMGLHICCCRRQRAGRGGAAGAAVPHAGVRPAASRGCGRRQRQTRAPQSRWGRRKHNKAGTWCAVGWTRGLVASSSSISLMLLPASSVCGSHPVVLCDSATK